MTWPNVSAVQIVTTRPHISDVDGDSPKRRKCRRADAQMRFGEREAGTELRAHVMNDGGVVGRVTEGVAEAKTSEAFAGRGRWWCHSIERRAEGEAEVKRV